VYLCTTSYHVACLTFCVLDFDGPVNFASRSEVGVLLQTCLAGYGGEGRIWLGVECRDVFMVFIFGCSAYIRRP
jgi:hypothetical protein